MGNLIKKYMAGQMSKMWNIIALQKSPVLHFFFFSNIMPYLDEVKFPIKRKKLWAAHKNPKSNDPTY